MGPAMKTLNLSGLEPRPLSRCVGPDLATCLDTALLCADEVLVEQGKQPSFYHLASMALFYEDGEVDEANYKGFQASYLSYSGGKPVVHGYGWSQVVCWGGHDAEMATGLRQKAGLRRYTLFVRHGRTWTIQHAGQLV